MRVRGLLQSVPVPGGPRDWYYVKHSKRVYHRTGDLPALIDLDGTLHYFVHGSLHREGDLPAVVRLNGFCEYYIHGRRERSGGPAIVGPNGHQEWFAKGKRHREDGPAIITPTEEAWYRKGERHRLDGPAYVSLVETAWFAFGFRHRYNGPALIRNGEEFWYIHGLEWSHGDLVTTDPVEMSLAVIQSEAEFSRMRYWHALRVLSAIGEQKAVSQLKKMKRLGIKLG